MIKYFAIFVLVVGVVSACGITYPDEWKEAEKVCEANGGVSKVFVYFDTNSVHCQNGAVFTLPTYRNMK